MKRKNTYLPGLDILKYILALLIVAGHCGLFLKDDLFSFIGEHLHEITIPTFFAVSAFLFFKKLEDSSPQYYKSLFKHTMLRLLIFFTVWYVLMLPYSIPHFFMKATIKEILYVVPFSCAFGGYWFIKALIINTAILYCCRGRKSLVICTIISLMLYLWGGYDYIYGTFAQKLHSYYCFYYHTIVFAIGALMARYNNFMQNFSSPLLIVFLLFVFLMSFIPIFRVFSRIIYPIPLILLFSRIERVNWENCKKIRTMSILYYAMHFGWIFLYNYLFQDNEALSNSIIRSIIIVMLITIISLMILYLEKKTYFSFLKYLH